jgi:hypothetical protein
MELLIPGLILVALMVWASTRVKRDAASAFEPETIETPHFIFDKPAGFLHVLNDDSGFELRAYSKEYGSGDNKGTRRAVIEVERLDGTAEERIASLASSGELSEMRTFIENEHKAYAFRQVGEKTSRTYKVVSNGDSWFEIRVIEPTEDDNESGGSVDTEALTGAFHLK